MKEYPWLNYGYCICFPNKFKEIRICNYLNTTLIAAGIYVLSEQVVRSKQA